MFELALIFVGGFLGSSHCIGMCGPLALALGSNTGSIQSNVGRQLIYSLGRIFTYSCGGAAAGFAGLWLTRQSVSVVNIQSWLAIVCGLVLIGLGLATAGVLPRLRWPTAFACPAGTWLRTFLVGPRLDYVFLAGVFTGFLPCGLVYAFVALAASTGSLVYGALTMVMFGLGTVPLMVMTGAGGSLISLTARARILKIAAWCVVVTGIVSVLRGTGYVDLPGFASAGCPLCR